MERQNDISQYSPLTLAYLGDAVYEMLVREYLVALGNTSVNSLHKQAVNMVSSSAQAKAFDMINGSLTDQEKAVFLRGRNASPYSIPKNADRSEYHKATGFEAVFGYLYLNKNDQRIKELFNIIVININKE